MQGLGGNYPKSADGMVYIAPDPSGLARAATKGRTGSGSPDSVDVDAAAGHNPLPVVGGTGARRSLFDGTGVAKGDAVESRGVTIGVADSSSSGSAAGNTTAVGGVGGGVSGGGVNGSAVAAASSLVNGVERSAAGCDGTGSTVGSLGCRLHGTVAAAGCNDCAAAAGSAESGDGDVDVCGEADESILLYDSSEESHDDDDDAGGDAWHLPLLPAAHVGSRKSAGGATAVLPRSDDGDAEPDADADADTAAVSERDVSLYDGSQATTGAGYGARDVEAREAMSADGSSPCGAEPASLTRKESRSLIRVASKRLTSLMLQMTADPSLECVRPKSTRTASSLGTAR